MNNCFSIYHTSGITSGQKSNFTCDSVPTKAILFFFGCSEVNSTWLITSELANQSARKVLFTCVVFTNTFYLHKEHLDYSDLWRQRGQEVRAPNLKSVGRRFKFRSDRRLLFFSAGLINSQLVCLRPVGILNLAMLAFFYHCLFKLVLKSSNREWPIKCLSAKMALWNSIVKEGMRFYDISLPVTSM